jgi:hypothetical protein
VSHSRLSRVSNPDKQKKTCLCHVNSMKRWTPPVQIMAMRFCEDRETEDDDPGILLYEPRDAGRPTKVIEPLVTANLCSIHYNYRVPSWQESVREEIGSMMRVGIIVPSKSPWTSPIVPSKRRMALCDCVEYR